MNNLRKKFERFCFQHRDKGIPNLMLYLSAGTAVVYLFSMFTGNDLLYNLLCFDRNLILQGQVWRLFTYALTTLRGNIMLQLVYLICYYSLGRAIEHVWGTLRFNLFYLTGVLMMDVYCMIFGGQADVYYLNLSLFLAYATMYPDAQFLLFFIIPIRAWVFALVDLFFVLGGLLLYPFPSNLFSIISLANYFLFFGKDVLNVLPLSWRVKMARKKNPKYQSGPKVVQFPGNRQAAQTAREDYTHRCCVCGRTDVSHPQLEFRYCSKCSGYHCYCQEHISNHQHITE